MKSDLYMSCDIDFCRGRGHKFKMTWSDKHPLQANLACIDCSEKYHKNAYVAYGVAARSFGPWRRRPPIPEPSTEERTTDE